MKNKIIKQYWSHIPFSLRKVYLLVIKTADGLVEVCGKTEKQAFDNAERMYNV